MCSQRWVCIAVGLWCKKYNMASAASDRPWLVQAARIENYPLILGQDCNMPDPVLVAPGTLGVIGKYRLVCLITWEIGEAALDGTLQAIGRQTSTNEQWHV